MDQGGMVESTGRDAPDERDPSAAPFAVYGALWTALAAATAATLWGEEAPSHATAYPALVAASIALVAAAPAIALLGGVFGRRRGVPRALSRSFARAALLSLAGAAAWLLALTLVDAVRLGWLP